MVGVLMKVVVNWQVYQDNYVNGFLSVSIKLKSPSSWIVLEKTSPTSISVAKESTDCDLNFCRRSKVLLEF